MNINFKKVVSVLASAAMLSSTVGFAAAATYPAPFSDGAAVVYGVNAANSDLTAAIDVFSNLKNVAGDTGTGDSFEGEVVELFSGGTKIYINDSLNKVKSILTKSDLPTVLADTTFSGNVEAKVSQTIVMGSNPRITFEKQPTSQDDPNFALKTSTQAANYIYNATATFKAINFTHSDSEGEEITLFGQTFTISSSTDTTDLVLLKSAEKFTLDLSDNPSKEVTIAGETFTVELVSSSDTAATIAVTNAAGQTASKEVSEAQSKKINGLTIAVNTADETNLKLSASIIAGAEKVTLTSGSDITLGDDTSSVQGSLATFTGGTGAMTKLVVSIAASESDMDAIKAGESIIDPVFGSFKLDFAGLNIASDSSAREEILINDAGDDRMEVTLNDHRGYDEVIQFAKNWTSGQYLQHTDDGNNISVFEKEGLQYNDMVVLGNEDEGYLMQLTSVDNNTHATDHTRDIAKFSDVFSEEAAISVVWSSEGIGTLTVGGNSYDVTMTGNANNATEDFRVRVNSPDSSAATNAIIYPTIETSQGANFAFYEPVTLNLTGWDGSTTDLNTLSFPDGDGYTDITIANVVTVGNWTIGGSNLDTDTLGKSANFSIGQLMYNATSDGTNNVTTVYLQTVGGANIDAPALVIFEEEDDNNAYEAMIVRIEGGSSGNGIGIEDVERTWSSDSSSWEHSVYGNSDITKEADLFGTIITLDAGQTSQKTAVISYPDEQIFAKLYVSEEGATITPGSTGGGGVISIMDDSQASSVTTKHLIVVGGSCVNTVAAKLLESDTPLCEAAFTDKTNVGANQYIIKTFASPYNAEKTAMLVAGYEAAETTMAANRAMEAITTDVGSEIIGPTTSVE
ncbi:hypothetical protein HOD75_04845 [archaeon]|jgi:hypothetical protein|nr:hypothetical protein [archaeon]MBT4242192.1 hypothetical protein [archaeon]MBT4417880.1 hypothetical protein [archaeon]